VQSYNTKSRLNAVFVQMAKKNLAGCTTFRHELIVVCNECNPPYGRLMDFAVLPRVRRCAP
ncbi:hypothetical protein, partial [uncultured Alistipes sp.]|uniref:hypothetical protein n=1 Tax=uncultured Alistipes sp. TaxID=538949 RepID=UPI0025B775F7